MTQYLYVDFILSFFGLFLYILGLKKVLFNEPKNLSGLKWNGLKKTLNIGIERISFFKSQKLLSDKIFLLNKLYCKVKENSYEKPFISLIL